MSTISMTRRLRDALVALIAQLQYDGGSGAEPAFSLVTGDPSQDFDSYPYCYVGPAPLMDTKGATGQNDREVQFVIITLLPLEGASITQSAQYDKMYDLCELVLDMLDEADYRDSLNTVDPTLGTWMMNATRSVPQPGTAKGGAVLIGSIDVSISYSKNL